MKTKTTETEMNSTINPDISPVATVTGLYRSTPSGFEPLSKDAPLTPDEVRNYPVFYELELAPEADDSDLIVDVSYDNMEPVRMPDLFRGTDIPRGVRFWPAWFEIPPYREMRDLSGRRVYPGRRACTRSGSGRHAACGASTAGNATSRQPTAATRARSSRWRSLRTMAGNRRRCRCCLLQGASPERREPEKTMTLSDENAPAGTDGLRTRAAACTAGLLLAAAIALLHLPPVLLLLPAGIIALGIAAGTASLHAVWYGVLSTLGIFDAGALAEEEKTVYAEKRHCFWFGEVATAAVLAGAVAAPVGSILAAQAARPLPSRQRPCSSCRSSSSCPSS